MTGNPPAVSIVTSAHWAGDARLNRHVAYLGASGWSAQIRSTAGGPRLISSLKALKLMASSDSDVLLLPDPELFLLGSVLGRTLGKRVVIDIHEDYAAAAASRSWIPSGLRRAVAMAVRVSTWLSRRVASRVIVAAPQLARRGDVVVWNVPSPMSIGLSPDVDLDQLCYVGDITEARGAFEMIELIHALGAPYRLLMIGQVSSRVSEPLQRMIYELGVADRVEMAGRLPHATAWERARISLAGLNLLRPVPAYVDAVGTKIWEYFLSGVPPVVSDLPGQADLVRGVSPELITGGIRERIAVITRLRSDHSYRQRTVDAGRRLAEAQWSKVRPDIRLQEAVAPRPMTDTVASEPKDE